MRAGESRIVDGQFAGLVATRNSGRAQQRFAPRTQAAVAAGHPAIIGAAGVPGHRLPSCALAERAYLHWRFYHLGPLHVRTNLLSSTLHPQSAFAQAGKIALLCTSCERRRWAVEGVGKRARRAGM